MKRWLGPIVIFLFALSATVAFTQEAPTLPDYKSWTKTFSTSLDIDVPRDGKVHRAVANVTMYYNSDNMDEVTEAVADTMVRLGEDMQHFVNHVVIISRDHEEDEIYFSVSLYREHHGELHFVATQRDSMDKNEFYQEMHMDQQDN